MATPHDIKLQLFKIGIKWKNEYKENWHVI